jgi:hypothetical protein
MNFNVIDIGYKWNIAIIVEFMAREMGESQENVFQNSLL